MLEQRKYSPQMAQHTLDACCPDVFGDNREGYSETIHLRHLMHGQGDTRFDGFEIIVGSYYQSIYLLLLGKIPLAFGRFPVFLTRRRPDTTCYPEVHIV